MQIDRDARRHRPKTRLDQRFEAERDRDRILYSSAFRRLGGVTQTVAARDEGYLVHNRLTHSLKVAQIGQRISEMLERAATKDGQLRSSIELRGGLSPTVVEAAGLAHDLGHPPFGHIAEEELDAAMLSEGVADGFEGNAQSLRILTKLSRIEAETVGLDLTRATLNAVLKYPWHRSGPNQRKWGAYRSEADDFQWARGQSGLGGEDRTLEAEIMDWADDITYAVHDAEDFYRVGLIPMGRYVRSEADRLKFVRRVLEDWPTKASAPAKPSEAELVEASELNLAIFPIEETFSGTSRERALLRGYNAGLIARYVQGTSVAPNGLRPDPAHVREVELLKMLTTYHVVENPLLSTQQEGQRTVVRELYATFRRAIDSGRTNIFPARLREDAETAVGESLEQRCRLVADVVAAMTEVQAVRIHRRLNGHDFGPLVDPAVM